MGLDVVQFNSISTYMVIGGEVQVDKITGTPEQMMQSGTGTLPQIHLLLTFI